MTYLLGFHVRREIVGDITLNVATAGSGPPLLLLHGHPQTMIVWRKIVPDLIKDYSVVLMDLRGYGDSDAPPSDPDQSTYSKRTMAQDAARLMTQLGHGRFSVIGHDRGGRVAHRLARDHAERVDKICVLDIAPTAAMYAQTSAAFARRYFWWFFLIQPAPFPETMIGRDPEYFLRRHIAGQVGTPGAVSEDVITEYLRCYRKPETIRAICEDYRAAASIDLEHDAEDDAKISAPLLALWGAKGVVGELFDVLACWRAIAENVQGHALDCGHAIQEERPAEVLDALTKFLRSG